MRKRIVLPVLAICLVFAGCDKQAASPAQAGLEQAANAMRALKPKQNSPDMTVKSWWEAKDALMQVNEAACQAFFSIANDAGKELSQLAAPDFTITRDCSRSEKYQRTIENVQIQSDTRAIVLARVRNITPPDNGASTDSHEQKIKDEGSALRYTLERADAKSDWVISTIESRSSFSSGWESTQQKHDPYNHRYVNDYYQ